MSLAIMAWRNLWRNRRRTIITQLGIAFGVFLAILFTGLGDGSYSQMIDYTARLGSGHVAIQHPDYDELPSLDKTVVDGDRLLRMAAEEPGVRWVVGRISGATMLATASASYGAGFIAVDPAAESDDTLQIVDAITEGEFFDPNVPDDQAIILGSKLAENLDAGLGKKVVFTMTDKHGEIVSGLGRVRGIVHAGSPSVDSGLVLLPIESVRTLLGYGPNEVTQIGIFLEDHTRASVVAAELRPRVGSQATVLTWRENNPDLNGFISMKLASGFIFEMVILLLIGAGIFNSLFVSVMERIREFGIMLAIGFMPRQIFALVMWESLWLALTGLVASAVVSAWPYYHFATTGIDTSSFIEEGTEMAGVNVAANPILYVDIAPHKLLTIVLVVISATLLSGLLPAWRAGRTAPSEAIKIV